MIGWHQPPPVPDLTRHEVEEDRVPRHAEGMAALFLARLGLECEGDLADTPLRMAKGLAELTYGLRHPYDPVADLGRTFPPASPDPQMIIARGVEFTSVCEHHVLPFTGTAAVGYVPKPGGRLVGLSKLARLVTGYAAAPTMQERLGEQVTAAIMTHLDADGAGCVITAVHTCLTLRGARSATASMVTSHLAGRFYEGPMRAEFLALSDRRT